MGLSGLALALYFVAERRGLAVRAEAVRGIGGGGLDRIFGPLGGVRIGEVLRRWRVGLCGGVTGKLTALLLSLVHNGTCLPLSGFGYVRSPATSLEHTLCNLHDRCHNYGVVAERGLTKGA